MKFRFILCFAALVCNCVAYAAPDVNVSPHDLVQIIGRVPDDISAVLVEDWYSTTDAIFCQQLSGEAGFLPKHFSKRIETTSSSGGERTWIVGRGDMQPGACGWTLKQIVVYLDKTASGIDPLRPSNIPVRIAYVCSAKENCPNTWASNDDASKPTYHRCNFALISNLGPGSSVNPCAQVDRSSIGTDLGKSEHILRPAQQKLRFVVIEVARHEGGPR
jgi:hypothetical protein